MAQQADIAVIGAGAAGLFAAIFAARTNPHQRIIALDSARKLGAKILVAGGGRCNVTHDVVEAAAYAGSSRNAIRKILLRFGVDETVRFFRALGVPLKREETGKLFPTTDDAHTVLDALLRAAGAAGVELLHPYRVESIERMGDGFAIRGYGGTLNARRVILATGGRSLPKSGSDGHGCQMAKALGHSLTPRVFPALVPLTLPRDHFLTQLSGIAVPVTLDMRAGSGKKLVSFTDSMLCTHFGISGPAALDISRYHIDAKLDDPAASLTANWLPDQTAESVEAALQALGRVSLVRYLTPFLPERLARALCAAAGVDPITPADQLTRDQRKGLARTLTQLVLPVTGNRGYTYAEVTAGGVPLSEVRLETMESRLCPGLYLCGEICDVDGRIGGYNFQWAWSSGYVAGVSAASAS